jgi:hypothetical protein
VDVGRTFVEAHDNTVRAIHSWMRLGLLVVFKGAQHTEQWCEQQYHNLDPAKVSSRSESDSEHLSHIPVSGV